MIYDKPRAELFAQDAPESEIKPFTAWLRGLGIAFEETNGYPEMESFNGLLQALNSYIKYLEQNGFAEWSADLEYPIGAGVRVGNVWYKAKRQNTNKPPSTSQSDWSVFLNAGDLSYADPLQIVDGQIRIKDATTTQKGVTRFAAATEVANKSNVSAAITPANAATVAQSTDIGVGQTWQNVTGSRALGATYTNNTGRPIQLSISVRDSGSTARVTLTIGGVVAVDLIDIAGGSAGYQQITAIVPNGQTYRLDTTNILSHWAELR